jgi:hypothetical protein
MPKKFLSKDFDLIENFNTCYDILKNPQKVAHVNTVLNLRGMAHGVRVRSFRIYICMIYV